MTVPARISLVTLGVRDVARATAFYEQLGWQLSSASNPSVSFFHTADSAFSLYGFDALAEDAGLPADPLPAFRGVSLAINMESEAEVDRVLGEAERAGGRILKPAQRVFWGGYSGYFTDPDGYAWEVAHNPGFPINDDGSIALPD
jgi:uncharacterized glyoxalase superfamily protein PhnB